MKELYKELELKLSPYGKATSYDAAEINCFPEFYREIFDYKIFGQNIMSVPQELDARYSNEEDWQRPFFFDYEKFTMRNGKMAVGFIEEVKQFRNDELSQINSEDFIKIGGIYGGEIFAVLNIIKMSVHTFHIADASVEEGYLQGILNSRGIEFKQFIKLLEPQTVCYLESTQNRSLYAKFEIRDNKKVRYEIYKEDNTWVIGVKTLDDKEEAFQYYREYIAAFMKRGYKLNFGPKFIIEEFS